MRRLEGRTAVITGAARGIGFGIAQRFASEGASLLLVDLLEDKLAEATAAIGENAKLLALDVTGRDAPDQVVRAAQSEFGKIDILVNNAGVAISGTIEEFDDAQWDRTLNVNLTAPFRLARAIVPEMAKNGYGRVVNISSMNGSIGMRGDTAYAVTKAGLEALTRAIAVDYGRFGITSNAVAPGSIVTPTNRDILGSLDPRTPMMKIVVFNKPVPGNGEVADIAAIVAYLASDEAKFVTGQVFAVDGGVTTTRFVPEEQGAEAERYLPDQTRMREQEGHR